MTCRKNNFTGQEGSGSLSEIDFANFLILRVDPFGG
jgi:hypothetical protein